ncbi:TBC1 domain family member 31 [Scaptodrosophila lebanonensis]|uniref:TBC1 domain family member 31 n=1 Tax=Drosophila lebanonensis TaxID=7225 RepID=A0A6J2UK82_DROLE|nr:TBC1 domain family member 31 [Scaptodrosophila lebanonensis]
MSLVTKNVFYKSEDETQSKLPRKSVQEQQPEDENVEGSEDENTLIFEESDDDERDTEDKNESEDDRDEGKIGESQLEAEHSQPLSVRSTTSDANGQPPKKYAFKLKQTESGNILTVHHTVQESGKTQRIRIAAACFNEFSNQLIVIDKRGNVFVFDFVCKRYWHLNFRIPKVCLLLPSPLHKSDYIVGNKLGQILTVDVNSSLLVNLNNIGTSAIDELSFGTRIQSSKASNSLLRFGHEAMLFNLQTLNVSHQLEFNQSRYTLKLAGYLPNSDQFFTCFTNDSVHIWSTVSLNTLQIAHPIKMRNRKLRLLPTSESIPEFALRPPNDSDVEDELTFSCQDQDYADGYLLSYCFTPDGNKFGLSTLDGYLLVLSTVTFDLDKLYRLRDFILKQFVFLPLPKERILFGITARSQAIMLDLAHTEFKLFVQSENAESLCLSRDGKLLSVLSRCGEVNIWSTCRLYNTLHAQTNCLKVLHSAFQQKKPLPACNVSGCMHQEIRKLLKRDRLSAILHEYGCYPEKYRFLIWTTLLELPCNGRDFQQLLKLGVPPIIKNRAQDLKIRSDSLKRAVVKVWSCLAQWCKVFAYADFMPNLIFPFVKQLPKNGLVAFELLVTLLLNHFELWFEFHPMPPANYLAMCENLLQRQDEQLCKFYKALQLQPKDYIWSLLSNAFSEVLDEQQWLAMWDNVFTEPPYFLIFLAVAYNLINREVLLRLPDKSAVQWFFHEQNPIEVLKLIAKARKLMDNCQPDLHPKRFIQNLTPLPKEAYPKFLRYPSECITQHEEHSVMQAQLHQDIDARIRHLELEESKVMERLHKGLQQEEHTRRIKEMEKLYEETLQREEERLLCQRKMLLLYQKEVRQRKSEVLTQLQESEQRRKALEMEKEIDALMRSIERERRRQNQEMLLAEDEIRNEEMEILAQRYFSQTSTAPLAQKYYDNIQKLCRERDHLQKNLREMTMNQLDRSSRTCPETSPELMEIERSILEIQREFCEVLNSERRE